MRTPLNAEARSYCKCAAGNAPIAEGSRIPYIAEIFLNQHTERNTSKTHRE
jgi:hypothetical protein